MVETVVDHVLAEPLLVTALHVDDGGHPAEFGRVVLLEPLERIGLDLDWQRRQAFVGAHGAAGYSAATSRTPAASSGRTAAIRSARRCCHTVATISARVT